MAPKKNNKKTSPKKIKKASVPKTPLNNNVRQLPDSSPSLGDPNALNNMLNNLQEIIEVIYNYNYTCIKL